MEIYKNFSNSQEVREWVLDNYSCAELDEVDVTKNKDTPLYDYKGGFYRIMNEYLRGGFEEEQTEYDIKGLQTFLKSRWITENIEVYRYVGIGEFLSLIKGTRRRQLYEYPCFLSTTMLKNEFSMQEIKEHRLCIRIRIPNGTEGTYIQEVNPYMPEYEILIPYRKKLKRINLFTYEITK